MPRLARRIAAVFLTLSLSLVALPAQAAVSDAERAARAVGYIDARQLADGSVPGFSPVGSTADAVLAIVAAGVGRPTMRDALNYLADQVAADQVPGVGLRAKVVLAWTATGRAPTAIGGVNLVRTIRGALTKAEGVTDLAVFDVALGVLALRGAGAKVPAAAWRRLVRTQCGDGGWSYDGRNPGENRHCDSGSGDWYTSDTNTTAYVVQALVDGGRAATRNPFAFFREIRDAAYGGWGYTWNFPTTDANSTAIVLQAYAAAGRTLPGAALRALRGLQHTRCGAFGFTYTDGVKTDPDPGATIGAVPGLRGRAMPFIGSVEGRAPSTPACPV